MHAAIFSSPLTLKTNYLDLINGPADHGRCNSYTCMKRLSAFFAFVARGLNFLCFFTGTPPQKIRLSIFQPDSTYGIRVGIDYSVSGRLDVYADGTYIFPQNGAYNDKVSLRLFPNHIDTQFLNKLPTTFYMDRHLRSYSFDKASDLVFILCSIPGTC